MFSALSVHALQYADYALEVSLVAVLLLRGWWKRYPAFFAYLTSFAFIDAILRPTILYSYGRSSTQYLYGYYVTDIILTLGAFILICLFFRRACARKKDLWPVLRTMLIAVFVLVAFLSCFTMSEHFGHLAMSFAVELSQNVYFACLVLNTLLYIMLQQVDCADEELNLLVCGLGLEFAGSAAAMALAALMPTWSDNVTFASFVIQISALGMCLIWLYAATRNPEKASARSAPTRYKPVPAFLQAHVPGTH
jgi:hypothetical protein